MNNSIDEVATIGVAISSEMCSHRVVAEWMEGFMSRVLDAKRSTPVGAPMPRREDMETVWDDLMAHHQFGDNGYGPE